MHRQRLRFVLLGAVLALVANGRGSEHRDHERGQHHAGLRGIRGSAAARSGARVGRRVASDHRPDVREPGGVPSGDDQAPARARDELEGEPERPRLDVQPAAERQVPGRHAVQRRRRLLQLQPLVQLPGSAPERRAVVLLDHGLRRLRQAGTDAPGRRSPLQELSRREQHDGATRSAAPLGVVPERDRAPELAIASPTALRKYKADAGTVDSTGTFRPGVTFATQNPVGTGPYRLEVARSGTASRSRRIRRTGARSPS